MKTTNFRTTLRVSLGALLSLSVLACQSEPLSPDAEFEPIVLDAAEQQELLANGSSSEQIPASALVCDPDDSASVGGLYYPGWTCAAAITHAESSLNSWHYRNACSQQAGTDINDPIDAAAVSSCVVDDNNNAIVSVDLCCEWRRGDAAQIRAVAQAESARLRSVQASGEKTVRRARVIATCVGASIGLAFCWLAAGVQMPVVGGLMLSIIMACLLIGGGNLGARVGEGLASRRRDNAERAVQADPSVQADIRRWNSLNRQLRGHRRALVRGMRGAPFRREA